MKMFLNFTKIHLLEDCIGFLESNFKNIFYIFTKIHLLDDNISFAETNFMKMFSKNL
ncbi:hypothetical protein [Spodoptera cosmioides nucleopolyhedrovirus]|uniref:Uncharacterized protein n=1 Tax=Spodoptera cosmioides nucleopolyhedrovirus TaxID=2605774 RepID=A0A6B7KKR0_9ABAC|nr:hypothetical protein [Spodoptera cosmioides nucleopolyhedrovirus]